MDEIQSVIIRGEDRPLILKMIFKGSTDPFDLVNWTKITVEFRKSDRTILEKTTDLQGGAFATFTEQTVVFTADVIGIGGNSISLVFDGIDDLDTVVNAWNGANPTNTVAFTGQAGTFVPTAITVNLAGGVAQTQEVSVINETLGKISVTLTDTDTLALKTGPNQSFRVFVDKGAPPNGDRRMIFFDSALNVINADI